jgi:serine phosphatase RsbU (regulator of sigma subunit)
MPILDGFEVLARLKADPDHRHVPVIVVSAMSDMDSVIRGIELGADDYLPKPFDPVLLHARLTSSLERKRLRDQEQRYLQSLQRELEIGENIQAEFLPGALPVAPGWDLSAYFHAAREVAGDFYDIFPLENNRLIALVLGDVCDKGVGAALYMALFRSLLRASATLECLAGTVSNSVDEAAAIAYSTVSFTNNYVARIHSDSTMFATVFFGVLDTKTGLLSYVNAGQDPPMILNATGVRCLLEKTGPAIGLFEDMPYQTATIQLEPGDALFVYSDGIPDAENADGEFFGRDAVTTLLSKAYQEAAVQPLDGIAAALHAHIGQMRQYDDMTMLYIRSA